LSLIFRPSLVEFEDLAPRASRRMTFSAPVRGPDLRPVAVPEKPFDAGEEFFVRPGAKRLTSTCSIIPAMAGGRDIAMVHRFWSRLIRVPRSPGLELRSSQTETNCGSRGP